MKAALLLSPERIAIQDTPKPRPAAGEVLLRTELAGICGTDVSFYLGHRVAQYPFVLGHEVLGRVAALGDGVTKFAVGQRVLVEPNYPCLSCRLCLSGRGAVCAQKGSPGVNLPGCFSEYFCAPAEFVWALPDGISDRDAATIEPLAVSVHGFMQSGAKAGDTIAVLGCGVVGLLLTHAAVAADVRVIAHDRFANKLEIARSLGAETPGQNVDIAQLWQQQGVSSIFECAGAPATLDLALRAAPRASQVVLLGLSSEPASFVPLRLVREGINIRTSMIYDHPGDFAHVIREVARGTLRPSCVVTHTYPLESLDRALAFAGTGEAGKIHITMT
ncbi:MAG TPA: alcohol dehydrogenase catalytic domain-containing protein [Acidobacteriota bacterium]|nr:alcohol dehydrogenase catalytic domain-containing protein [Acidobacteriota bacterium]